MFSIKIKGYRYGTGGTPVEIRCGGYAYGAGTLISAKCNTEGTSDPVGIGLEDNKVIITIGSGGSTWYYDHFTAEYSGWKSKDYLKHFSHKNHSNYAEYRKMKDFFEEYTSELLLTINESLEIINYGKADAAKIEAQPDSISIFKTFFASFII